MITLPKYLSFVGVDEFTDIEKLSDFIYYSSNIEIGFLYGSNPGTKIRYPSRNFIANAVYNIRKRLKFSQSINKNISIHLCGKRAVEYLSNTMSLEDHRLLNNFDTVQINSTSYDYEKLLKAKTSYKKVVQFRGDYFPPNTELVHLLDRSGGKGLSITQDSNGFPYLHDKNQLVGVAGGVNISSLSSIINACPYKNYYLDMESGVRDNDDKFSIEMCKEMCKEIYNKA